MLYKTSRLLVSSALVTLFVGAPAYATNTTLDIDTLADKGFIAAYGDTYAQRSEGMRLSHLTPLVDTRGVRYGEYYMLGDGNCGRYALGCRTFQEAQQLLLDLPEDGAEKNTILEMAHYQILKDLIEGRLSASMNIGDTKEIFEEYSNLRAAQDMMVNEGVPLRERAPINQMVDGLRAILAQWAMQEETYLNYVNHVLVDGHMMEFNQDQPGTRTEPTFLNVLARRLQKNLVVMTQGNGLSREAAGNQRLHGDHFANYGFQNTSYLVYRPGHFNRLVPLDQEEDCEIAEKDERYYIDYLADQSSRALKVFCKDSFNALQKDFLSFFEPVEGIDDERKELWRSALSFLNTKQINPSLEDLHLQQITRDNMTRLLVRAYTLAADTIESQYGDYHMPAAEKEKIQHYENLCAILSKSSSQNAGDEEQLNKDLFMLYQGIQDEYNRLEWVEPTEANEISYKALIGEWKEIFEPLSIKARFIFGDGQNVYVRGYVDAKAKGVAESQTSKTISLSAYGCALTTSATYGQVHTYLMGRQNNGAYVNPHVMMYDPYLSSYNYSIYEDPAYQDVMSSAQIQVFGRDVYDILAGANDDTGQLRTQLNKLNGEEISWRRMKRLYDHYLGGRQANAHKLAAARKLMAAILSNWAGCIDGVRDAIAAAERAAFGSNVPETALQRISQIITADRLSCIRSLDGAFAEGSENKMYVPSMLQSALVGCFAMPGSVSQYMHGGPLGVVSREPFRPVDIVRGYLEGAQLTYDNTVNVAARTPDYLSDMIFGMSYLSQTVSADSSKNTRQEIAGDQERSKYYDYAINFYPDLERKSPQDFQITMELARGFKGLLNEFIGKDQYLHSKMEEVSIMLEENDLFTEDYNDPYKKGFFDYLLRKTGYVIDPNTPAEQKPHLWWNSSLNDIQGDAAQTIMLKKRQESKDYFDQKVSEFIKASGGSAGIAGRYTGRDVYDLRVAQLFAAYERTQNYNARVVFNNEILAAQRVLGELMMKGTPKMLDTDLSPLQKRVMKIEILREIQTYLFDLYGRQTNFDVQVAINKEILNIQTEMNILMTTK